VPQRLGPLHSRSLFMSLFAIFLCPTNVKFPCPERGALQIGRRTKRNVDCLENRTEMCGNNRNSVNGTAYIMAHALAAPITIPFTRKRHKDFRLNFHRLYYVSSEVFTAVSMNNAGFEDDTPCGCYTNRRFGGM
jgi:hypothetical protein